MHAILALGQRRVDLVREEGRVVEHSGGGLFGWLRKKAEPKLTSKELDEKIKLKERIIEELEREMDRNPSEKHTRHVPRQSNVNDIRESQAARLRILKVDLEALYRQREVAENEGR
jgi:hypothetical protein